MVYNKSGRPDKTVEEFLKQAEKIKSKIKREINLTDNESDVYVMQLNKILIEVEKMSINLCPNNYLPAFPRVIVD
ncbi:MAG: hypothetical protein H0Z32_14300 [Bacillaceae bacterium]|nr:hypothetical protein [Bacillaceae bacterium]